MASDTPARTDLSGEELYIVVRKAVEDAIVSAIGTVVQVALGFVLVWLGVFIAVAGYSDKLVQVAGGVVVLLAGLYFVGSALGWDLSAERLG